MVESILVCLMRKQLKLIVILLVTLSFSIVKSQELSPAQLTNIHSFLQTFENAAKAKDTNTLKELIYPIVILGQNYQDDAIKCVLANDTSSRGDYAYSQKALKLIIDSLYTKFVPLTKNWRDLFNQMEESNTRIRSIYKLRTGLFRL